MLFRGFANRLTLSRILVIPVILVLLLLQGALAAWCGMLLFVAAALTDCLDGYVARRYGEVSKLGQILDPIADKLLVAGVILVLVYTGRIGASLILPALIILLREVAVSGLREFLAENLRVRLPVTQLAKWKSIVQMTALPFLIMAVHAPAFIPADVIGGALLWAAGLLTVVTGWDYWQATVKYLREEMASSAKGR